MKRRKTIIIRHPMLKRLRDNLRLLIIKAEGQEFHKLIEMDEKLLFDEKGQPVKLTPEIRQQSREIERKKQALERALDKSICYCTVCGKYDKDMTYNTQVDKWYCVECYRDLPGNLKPEWHPEYPITKAQMVEFFRRLNKVGAKCGASFRHTRHILNDMGVSHNDQIQFINICKEYGGYNDAEILMNAQRDVYTDFGMEDEFNKMFYQ